MVIAIVYFVFGNGKIYGEPYIANLNRDLSYNHLRFELMEKGTFLLPKPYYKINFCKLRLQNSDGTFICFDQRIMKPLLHECVDRVLNEKENTKKVIQLIVEWDLSLKTNFESNSMKEQINENYSLQDNFNNNSKQTPVPLIQLLDNFTKPEPIQFWNCPKCKQTSGSMQIKFDYLPDILVFYLKRFDQSGSHAKKNDKNVYALEELDMSSYIDNQHLLKDLSKHRGKFEYNGNKYDLSSIIYHHGYAFSSGHYTAAARNSIDGKWRLFNDDRVSDKSQSEISESNCSYMLFYQRRPFVPWFHHTVPLHIIQEYQEMDRDVRKYKQRNNSQKQNKYSHY
uniref:ubiquitinyl hydrolase 1 n=1 Tax=Meloidogyne enterolobii TaxID=390850 RepID=A0A6V7WW72_MELEN|nr:unnamed protein product [Meloidogyne enterolobii]